MLNYAPTIYHVLLQSQTKPDFSKIALMKRKRINRRKIFDGKRVFHFYYPLLHRDKNEMSLRYCTLMSQYNKPIHHPQFL